ncbi:uncharacterized protein LOC143216447 isoform X2 [Lasioglossum baleicum]|uniref:uncharacterized protein LOC143216447 isoform X2 n=1 Tax=Lasioglossum baleicum TaxID=434251 RepID=UPI003FCEBBC8
MEVVEINTKRPQLPPRKPLDCPCNVRCTKRYVQPLRVKSFAPERKYCPPSKLLDTDTTYHVSYLSVDHGDKRHSRSQPIRPTPALGKFEGKFSDETTSKLSYKQPTDGPIPRTRPILPKQRPMIGTGRMEHVTTVRQDFSRKHVEKPELIVPCGHIRMSTGKLDAGTTARLSYADPGYVEPTLNFKPIRVYRPPSEPVRHETTQKLSYQPVQVQEKDSCPWRIKPTYRPPDVAMCGQTTYSQSFLQNEELCTEKPIKPSGNILFPHGAEFAARTIYKESYRVEPSCGDRVQPFLPCNSISRPDGKMSGDTTNKLSYQPIRTDERAMPILPRYRNMIGDGPMQSETTNRCDFSPKCSATRPEPIIPSGNLRSSESPMDDTTTTRLSYAVPEPMECVQSFKPVVQYAKSPYKIDSETVSKLSYQQWTPAPKEKLAWAVKRKYQPPKETMCSDTIYQASYPAPGHYEQICEEQQAECDRFNAKNDCTPCPSTQDQVCENSNESHP